MRVIQAAVIFLGIFLASCDDKNAKDTSDLSARMIEVENRAINGQQWRITHYAESNVSKTSLFAGYIFEFDSNNLLTVTNGSDNIAGNWFVTPDASDDENTSSEFDGINFNLSFTNPPLFLALTEDWKILSVTDARIELRKNSGGNGRIDLLTFEKI